MIKRQSLPAILLLGLLFVYSCGDDNGPTGGGDDDGTTIDTLPNAGGMLWVYEVYDSLAETTDTVWLSVTDTVGDSSEGFTGLRCRLKWIIAGSVVERYIAIKGDTIDIWSDTTTEPTLLERFVLPLSLGSEWLGIDAWDSSRVTDVRAVTVPAGTFDSTALVERSWDRDFEGGGSRSRTWLAPNVGIVSRYLFREFSDGSTFTVTVNQTWELIRYDLSTFSQEQFPNAVGTEWVYELRDTRLDSPDTVTVTIMETTEITWAGSGTLWQYVGKEFTDTLWVGESDDTLFVSPDPTYKAFGCWFYEFPLAVGRYWASTTPWRRPRIIDKGEVISLAGAFPSAFHFSQSFSLLNDRWTFDDWLVPGVGMVIGKHTLEGFGAYFVQDWNLISYTLP
jgi:hypothetical protein